MSAAAERAACAAHYWARRGDRDALRGVYKNLTEDELDDVAWLLVTCADGFKALTDEQLTARMLGLAAAPAPEIF